MRSPPRYLSGQSESSDEDNPYPKGFVLWKKFDKLPRLPGFGSNVVIFFRNQFLSGSVSPQKGFSRNSVPLLGDVPKREEVKLTKEICRHLMFNGVKSIQLMSNYSDYREAICSGITEEMKEMEEFSEMKVNEVDTEVIIKSEKRYDYVDVCVVLLNACRGRCQQSKLWHLVSEAYRASKLGVVIIGDRSTIDDYIFCEEWQEFIDYISKDGGGWKDHLEIVCTRHKKMNKQIFTAKDLIEQAPSGGCTILCGEMTCGHYCPYVCHVTDPDHDSDKYKCDKSCLRICMFGHRCPEVCSKNCNLCYYVITIPMSCVHSPNTEIQVFCHQRWSIKRCQVLTKRRLDCGHYVRTTCSADLSIIKCTRLLQCTLTCGHNFTFECWENIQEVICQVAVVKKFPCGHEIALKCDENTRVGDTLQCNLLCTTKLPCGHFCGKSCHLEDPNHENFLCMQPCKRYCVRKLHNCRERKLDHPCHVPCMPCDVIFEYQLPCYHGFMIRCNDPDPDDEEYFCREQCTRIRPFCRHTCPKLCGEECGTCETLVKKYPEQCTRGHWSMVPCQVLRPKLCKAKVLCKKIPECGHRVYVYCHEADTICREELAEICDEPCTKRFDAQHECGHKCVGSCRDCYQGRLHMRCEEPCGRLLICGHNCLEPCKMVCPPCHLPCFNSCEHGQCEYECGVPCVRECEQPCPYECEHLKCTRKCHEVCDRQGCNEHCAKLLECGHPCIGFCGEPCPPLCGICTPEKLLEGTFSGNTELDPNDKFIYLPDCGHCVESSDFELWINIKSEEILPIRCPVCNARLKWIRRYSQIFSNNHQMIQSVRIKIFGEKEEIEGILNDVAERVKAHEKSTNGTPYFIEYVGYIMNEVNRPVFAKPKLVEPSTEEEEGKEAKLQSVCIKNAKFLKWICGEWINASEILAMFAPKLRPEDFTKFYHHWEHYIMDMPTERVWPMHPNEIAQMEVERMRMDDIVSLFSRMDITTNSNVIRLISTGNASVMLLALENFLMQNKPYDPLMQEFFGHQVKELDAVLRCTINISDRERQEIVAVFGPNSGRWFKCPNGHVYVVTECGGATEVGKCNECGAEIGGTNHVLVEDNYLATEMDGASQPMYPTVLLRNNNNN